MLSSMGMRYSILPRVVKLSREDSTLFGTIRFRVLDTKQYYSKQKLRLTCVLRYSIIYKVKTNSPHRRTQL